MRFHGNKIISKYAKKKTEANKKPVNVLSVIFCSSDSSEDVKDDPESDDELEVDDDEEDPEEPEVDGGLRLCMAAFNKLR